MVVAPGVKIPPNSYPVSVFCDGSDGVVVGSTMISCSNKTWSSEPGQCLRTCPSVQPTQNLHVTCFYQNQKLANCSKPVEGTIIKYECSHFYEDLKVSEHTVQVCRDRSWSQKTPECIPACGLKPRSAQPLIINGVNVQRGDYPWQVAIYNNSTKGFICGGSLINERVVLTAANCFKKGLRSKEMYIVAVGKYYREFNDLRDAHEAQFSTLQDLYLPDEYQGINNYYLGDLAVLITTKSFVFSRRIQPVCVDWSLNYTRNFSKDSWGYIVGWGSTNDSPQLSTNLQELKVPVINREECLLHIDDEFKNYMTEDKLCAGYLQGKAINEGDGGSGLVAQLNDRYYLIGVATSCPKTSSSSCDSEQYAFYTNVSVYVQFIIDKMKNINVTEDIQSSEKSVVFDQINYFTETEKRAMCPSIATTASTQVSCISTKNQIINCLNPVHGTVAMFSCAPFYENAKFHETPFRSCKHGSWNQKRPACLPVCGIKPVQAQTLVIGGTETRRESHPWQAAIYKINHQNGNKELICGGSMIHQRIILTAAHCVTNLIDNTLMSKDLFIVAVGKYYRDFNDTRDTDAQFSPLTAILVPQQYEGDLQNYYGDIALLVTKKSFVLYNYIRPVCVDWSGDYEWAMLRSHLKGTVAGWGFTQGNSNPSEKLKVLEVPYINSSMCRSKVPFEFRPYITYDKICSGYLNANASVCKGDSGGGLVFKNENNGKYYITGIVSVSPQAPTGGCDSQQYTLYTRVSHYVNDFILNTYRQYLDD